MKVKTTTIVLITSLLFLAGCGQDPSKSDEQSFEEQAQDNRVPAAYGRFVPEREDDFAWENDKVAFRVYGPASPMGGPVSGVDAWFKKVDYPIIDKWYVEHLQGKSYHEDQHNLHPEW